MSPVSVIKSLVKTAFQSVGLDVRRGKNSPRMTMLGLRELPYSTIIDVGANKGQFAHDIQRFFPQAMIYCFEPLPEPFRELKEWAASQAGRVQAFNMALGESDGEITMHCHVDHTPSSSLLKATELNMVHHPFIKTKQSQTIAIARLDDVLSQISAQLEGEVLLKLDVQGYEDRVLRGATETLKVASACVLEVNLDALYEGQANFQTLVSLLSDAGFEYAGNLSQFYGEDGHVMWIDALFRKPQ